MLDVGTCATVREYAIVCVCRTLANLAARHRYARAIRHTNSGRTHARTTHDAHEAHEMRRNEMRCNLAMACTSKCPRAIGKRAELSESLLLQMTFLRSGRLSPRDDGADFYRMNMIWGPTRGPIRRSTAGAAAAASASAAPATATTTITAPTTITTKLIANGRTSRAGPSGGMCNKTERMFGPRVHYMYKLGRRRIHRSSSRVTY